MGVTTLGEFTELVDKATSPLLPAGHDDMVLSLEVCDAIRSKAVAPQRAAQKLLARAVHSNPHVQRRAMAVRCRKLTLSSSICA